MRGLYRRALALIPEQPPAAWKKERAALCPESNKVELSQPHPSQARPVQPAVGDSLTCLVRSSMQMAPPPRTYLHRKVSELCLVGALSFFFTLCLKNYPVPLAQPLTLRRGLETQP